MTNRNSFNHQSAIDKNECFILNIEIIFNHIAAETIYEKASSGYNGQEKANIKEILLQHKEWNRYGMGRGEKVIQNNLVLEKIKEKERKIFLLTIKTKIKRNSLHRLI